MSTLILEFIRSGQVEPLQDDTYGIIYRCSALLHDGTYLPCVLLAQGEPLVKMALRRFDKESCRKKGAQSSESYAYEQVVRHFVTTGNRVNSYDIATLQPSPFAIPLSLLLQIEGETTMAWTGFVLEMNDRSLFSYGTRFATDFFHLPDGYTFRDVVCLHNHSYVSPAGHLRALPQGMAELPADYDASMVFRERPCFVCHYDE